MKNLQAISRSKYIFVLGLLAIGIGVISKKIISYPIKCAPVNNQEITYLKFKWIELSVKLFKIYII